MRFGVSGKIFLAYAALVGAFIASSIFSLVYLARAREQVLASQVFFDVQTHTEAAWRKLNDFPSEPRRRPDPTLPLILVEARKHLRAAVAAIDGHTAGRTNLPASGDFVVYRQRLSLFDAKLGDLAARLGAYEASDDAAKREEFVRELVNLTNALDRIRSSTSAETRAAADELSVAGETARSFALVLGGAGLLVAVGAALFLYRTIQPLRVLRQRTREIAAGDYARRVGVQSHDEIGDLAREFDAMALALHEREVRLIRSERLATVGRMAAQITHEVRNPLASIGLYAELLQDELPVTNAEARRLTAAVASEVDRLSDITDNYLRFVRLPRPRREREDIGAIVRSAIEFTRAELALSGVTVELQLPERPAEADVDENQIRQALLNLVRNAKEAMPDGGRLRVEVAAGLADTVRVVIADTGAGIAADDVQKIFDPFFSTKAKGTGLGLALVQQIVSDHQGRIDVQAAAGGGTAFAITLPGIGTEDSPTDAADGSDAAPPDPPPDPSSGSWRG